MIRCPTCSAEHLPNTLFCDQCGEALHPAGRAVPRPESRAARLWKLRVEITSTGSTLTVPLSHEIIIGRRDEDTGIHPDIDLSVLGDAAFSVSRQHLCIRRLGNRITIEDLDSTNGTRLQDRRLRPHQAVTLLEKQRYDLRVGTIHLFIKVIEMEH